MILIFSFCNAYSFAFSEEVLDIHYYSDGSYGVTLLKTSNSKGITTGTKGYKHYDSNDNLVWEASITASFTYNGTTATCIDVSKSITVYDSSWKCKTADCSKDGETAMGSFTMKRHRFLKPSQNQSCSFTLTCDKNGNIT